MVEGVLLRGILLLHCAERSHPAILQTHYGVRNKASSDFAYSLFVGDGGIMDSKAVRVAGQGVRVVEVAVSGAYKRGEVAWSLQACI